MGDDQPGRSRRGAGVRSRRSGGATGARADRRARTDPEAGPRFRPCLSRRSARRRTPRSARGRQQPGFQIRGSRLSAEATTELRRPVTMPLELWLTYLGMCFLFAATPGPAVILTAGQSIARGFGAGFAVILGTQLGNLIYFVVSAAGLGAILIASETAFMLIKYAGAAYLIYLGVRTIWRASRAADPEPDEKLPLWRHPFTQGLLNQLANPKSILFWGALFPQFVDFRAPDLLLQFAILAVTGILA